MRMSLLVGAGRQVRGIGRAVRYMDVFGSPPFRRRAAMSRSNEGRCCDAVLSIIEGMEGGRREILSMDTPHSRGVEVRCKIQGTVYAIEHTLIDPYPDKRRDD